MTSWLVIVAVGVGSIVMRTVPLVARSDATMSPRLERIVHHAGTAAITALVVSSTVSAGRGPTPLSAVVAAVGVGLVLAVTGRPMMVVVVVGLGVAAAATLVIVVVSRTGGLSS